MEKKQGTVGIEKVRREAVSSTYHSLRMFIIKREAHNTSIGTKVERSEAPALYAKTRLKKEPALQRRG